jgi:hypothetical protein
MNTVEVEVKSTTLTNVQEYKGKRYGNQRVGLHNGSDFPIPFDVYVEEANPYPKGRYVIDGRSYTTDEKGRLVLKRLKLLPLGGKAGI